MFMPFLGPDFRAPPGHPSKIPGYPAKSFISRSFEGHTELFGPHPFMWKTPTPPENIQTQEFGFVLFRSLDRTLFWGLFWETCVSQKKTPKFPQKPEPPKKGSIFVFNLNSTWPFLQNPGGPSGLKRCLNRAFFYQNRAYFRDEQLGP